MIRARSTLALTALLTFVLAAPAFAGPPWISIEYPANPYDAATRGALMLVHTYHHGGAVAYPVTAVAEGLVDGERRTIRLSVSSTSRSGVWAVSGALPAGGSFVVTATLRERGTETRASALVGLAPGGRLVGVRVPSDRRDGWVIPRTPRAGEVDAMLRATAAAARATADAVSTDAEPTTHGALTLLALTLLPLAGIARRRRRR